MRVIDGMTVMICNFVVAALMYWGLWLCSMPTSFGELYIALVLVDVGYYCSRRRV